MSSVADLRTFTPGSHVMGAREIRVERFLERLLARKRELEELLRVASASTRPVELDPGREGRLSRADALEQQAVQMQAQARRRAELARIERALRSIHEGEYGYCALCGEPISEKRLELDPTIITCIRCAERQA